MTILGIETSCDETSVAVLEARGSYPELEYRVPAHIVHSQVDVHSKYGGVFPMMAKREHAKRLVPLLEQALKEAETGSKAFEAGKEKLEEMRKICGEHDEELYRSIIGSSLVKMKPALDRIAVTRGPGLEPALWVGLNFARCLSVLWDIPASGINHMEGHIAASLIERADNRYSFERVKGCPLPAIAFLMSGGHSEIVLIKEIGKYEILGATRDDAIGEAFDKVARMLGLPYPGGPEISKLADTARKEGLARNIKLPRPMIDSDDLDMSFAGLKTAVLYGLRKHEEVTDGLRKEIAREFEDSVTDVVVSKLRKSFGRQGAHALIAGGGVIANAHIRAACDSLAAELGVPFFPPAQGLSGDNALMIALASALHGDKVTDELEAEGNLSLQA